MAIHAHSTRTSLLRLTSEPSRLLRQAPRLIAAGGPVTQAVRAMRAAAPQTAADLAILALDAGIARYLAQTATLEAAGACA